MPEPSAAALAMNRAEIALREFLSPEEAPSALAEDFYDLINRVLLRYTNQQEYERRDALIQALADLVSVWGTPEIWESFQPWSEPTKGDTS